MEQSIDISKYDAMCEDLEKQELDAPDGVPPVHIYQQLLAIYLLQNDLTSAKFLWKRIPPQSKSSASELGLIWGVGQKLWLRDLHGVYSTLNQGWSATVKEIMEALLTRTRQRAITLVSNAYTSISLEDFSHIVGLSSEESLEKVKSLDWGFDGPSQMILPKRPSLKLANPVPSEEQLHRLTEYVSFLEN